MYIPEIVPISDLRVRQSELLEQIGKAPIVLTQYGRPAAVLVDPEEWNQIQGQLEDLDDLVTVLRAELAVARGEAELVDADIEALEVMVKGERLPS